MNLFKIVPIFIGIVFVFILVYWCVFGYISYKALQVAQNQDYSGGVKPVIEKVWCGQPGCLDNPKK